MLVQNKCCNISNGGFIPNIDIIYGKGTRLKNGTGVDLLGTSSNIGIVEGRELLAIGLRNGDGVIFTILYAMV